MIYGQNFGGPMFNSDDSQEQQHPQYEILKRHVERCVQDMFLEALRTQPNELCFLFGDELQIDEFTKRMLSYWEASENFEICQEILELSSTFKEKWRNRTDLDPGKGSARIIDIFGSKSK